MSKLDFELLNARKARLERCLIRLAKQQKEIDRWVAITRKELLYTERLLEKAENEDYLSVNHNS